MGEQVELCMVKGGDEAGDSRDREEREEAIERRLSERTSKLKQC